MMALVLLPLLARAGGVHSGDSSPFAINIGGYPNGARWVSATAGFFLDTWTPCCSRTASGESNSFSIQRPPALRFLAGDVLDADSGLPVPGAQLSLAPGSGAADGGPNGWFRLAPVAQGNNYQLSAQHMGYWPAMVSGIDVEEHRPAFQRIWLEPIRPSAVTGLQITADSVNVHLSWNPVGGATGYRVRAAWDQGGYWSPQVTTTQTDWTTPFLQGVEQVRFYRVSSVQ
jgi:hypothetical protein